MPNLSSLGCIGKLEFVDLGSLVNSSQQKIYIHLLLFTKLFTKASAKFAGLDTNIRTFLKYLETS